MKTYIADEVCKNPISGFAVIRVDGEYCERIHCPEHGRDEYVPWRPLNQDLIFWYRMGKHPRFSVIEAFKGADQTGDEVGSFMWPIRFESGENRTIRNAIFDAMKVSESSEDFIREMKPFLFADLVTDDRTHRVRNAFLEKHKAKSFKAEDFFNEGNHDLRRLILRAGAPMKDVLAGLTFVCRDEEGTLYDDKNASGRRDNDQERAWFRSGPDPRYLHVVCPSTGAEYLLGVPSDINTPKAARRWTFDLPEDAEFIKEA